MKVRTLKHLNQPAYESTKLDWSLLDSLVRHASVRDSSISQKFSTYVLRNHFRLNENEALDALTDASQDRGIDAVVLDEITREVHFFQFKYYEAEEHLRRQFPSRCVDKIIAFLDDLLQHREHIFDGVNRLLSTKIRQIWDMIETGPIGIHIHLASNGRKLEPVHRERLLAALQKYGGNLWEYGASDLVRSAVRRRNTRDRRRLTFQTNARLEFYANDKRMLTGISSLHEVAGLLRDRESHSQLDHSLFTGNVRGVLGMDNDVNRSIERTLFSASGKNFVFFNNGITIVAEQVLYQAGGNFPVEMINPQIVNGCQTASVIFRAVSVDERRFRTGDYSVQVCIIESADPKFTEEVALATNSQTRIYGRDLRAVDEVQIKIERALRQHGFCYLRKRSDTSELPIAQTIDMARLGQIVLAYYRRQPELAKTKSDEIFGDLYEDVFDINFLTAERMIAVHMLSSVVEERRQIARQRLRSISNRYHEEWILEGHFHVLFVLGLICDRDGVDLCDVKSAALRLIEAIDIVSEFASRHANVAAYRLFRTTGTSENLAKIVSKTRPQESGKPQYDLFSDPVIGFTA